MYSLRGLYEPKCSEAHCPIGTTIAGNNNNNDNNNNNNNNNNNR
jgi:hypothetical protein